MSVPGTPEAVEVNYDNSGKASAEDVPNQPEIVHSTLQAPAAAEPFAAEVSQMTAVKPENNLSSAEISDVAAKYKNLKKEDMDTIAEIVGTKASDDSKAEAVASIVKEAEEKGDSKEAGKIEEVGNQMAPAFNVTDLIQNVNKVQEQLAQYNNYKALQQKSAP